ncbi:MAG TPA: FAD-dependent oxidoreductase [Candidatus Binatia bacterium]|nr:FAD-dependent oxidoreductase [Candidatus Binatia bacterium]
MKQSRREDYILGGGMTGLAAGRSSGLPVLEAREAPGGICSSYYMRPHSEERLLQAPEDEEAYRFEIGGGHWIFGGDPAVLHFIEQTTPVCRYRRKSAVYFPGEDLYIPYPLQNHLRYLGKDVAGNALKELAQPGKAAETMAEWLESSFGPTLCERFFYPFHDLYTAGLYKKIAPQDAYKSPVKLGQAIEGALGETDAVGYNVTFVYPAAGLNVLARRMAAGADVRYGQRVTKVDVSNKTLHLSDGSKRAYRQLISTLPLNKMMEMTGLDVGVKADPYTSVLVLNIGARRGQKCPGEHWLYIPTSKAGFHRVGFYSHVDPSFLPASRRPPSEESNGQSTMGSGVSIYVERAFMGGEKPTAEEVQSYSKAVVEELQSWGFIEEAEVVDPTWIDVAYTWSWPHSAWKKEALKRLEQEEIYQVGRYARWIFQGIADSIRDGFFAGSCFVERSREEPEREPVARMSAVAEGG